MKGNNTELSVPLSIKKEFFELFVTVVERSEILTSPSVDLQMAFSKSANSSCSACLKY